MTLLLIFLAFVAAGLYFARLVVYPKIFSLEETYRTEIETGRMDAAVFEAYRPQAVEIRSPFGYNLFGYYLQQPQGSARSVILAHGITYSLYGAVKYIELFWRRGYNIFLYDHRAHGRSGGRGCTFGLYETYDLQACFDWVQNQLPSGGIVGIHGESYGAAIALQFAARDARPAFVVADAAFADLTALLRHRLRVDYHLPAFPLLNLASFWAARLTGMAFGMISPVRTAANIRCPVFFIHGADDTFTPAWMSQSLYHAKTNGARRLLFIPHAEHAQSYWTDPIRYDRELGEFLTENSLPQE
ncbi:MAG: alpha/beta hydrolase [Anaerolineales bacterium]